MSVTASGQDYFAQYVYYFDWRPVACSPLVKLTSRYFCMEGPDQIEEFFSRASDTERTLFAGTFKQVIQRIEYCARQDGIFVFGFVLSRDREVTAASVRGIAKAISKEIKRRLGHTFGELHDITALNFSLFSSTLKTLDPRLTLSTEPVEVVISPGRKIDAIVDNDSEIAALDAVAASGTLPRPAILRLRRNMFRSYENCLRRIVDHQQTSTLWIKLFFWTLVVVFFIVHIIALLISNWSFFLFSLSLFASIVALYTIRGLIYILRSRIPRLRLLRATAGYLNHANAYSQIADNVFRSAGCDTKRGGCDGLIGALYARIEGEAQALETQKLVVATGCALSLAAFIAAASPFMISRTGESQTLIAPNHTTDHY